MGYAKIRGWESFYKCVLNNPVGYILDKKVIFMPK